MGIEALLWFSNSVFQHSVQALSWRNRSTERVRDRAAELGRLAKAVSAKRKNVLSNAVRTFRRKVKCRCDVDAKKYILCNATRLMHDETNDHVTLINYTEGTMKMNSVFWSAFIIILAITMHQHSPLITNLFHHIVSCNMMHGVRAAMVKNNGIDVKCSHIRF